MSTQNAKVQPGQFLTFSLQKQCYGVSIATVREINRVAEITQVPQTPDFIAGVMNLRGKVIPVVNLRTKFGMQKVEATKQTCIIVIEGESGQIGMIVDSVNGVIDLKDEQIEPAPAMGDESKLAYVMGLGKVENEVIILVDIISTLSRENLRGIAELQASQNAAA